jgi:hypothetical protein
MCPYILSKIIMKLVVSYPIRDFMITWRTARISSVQAWAQPTHLESPTLGHGSYHHARTQIIMQVVITSHIISTLHVLAWSRTKAQQDWSTPNVCFTSFLALSCSLANLSFSLLEDWGLSSQIWTMQDRYHQLDSTLGFAFHEAR